MNDGVFLVGFMENPPIIQKPKSNEEVELTKFVLVYNNGLSQVKVPCLAIGDCGKNLFLNGIKGSQWEIQGKMSNFGGEKKFSDNYIVPLIQVIVTNCTLISKPKMAGVGFREFTDNYTPEGMTAKYLKKERKIQGKIKEAVARKEKKANG